VATLPVFPDFVVSGYTIRDSRNLSQDNQDRLNQFIVRSIFDEIPPECLCQDPYYKTQLREAIRENYGSTAAATFENVVYPSLLPVTIMRGDVDPVRFIVISGGQPFGGASWFAISGQLVSGQIHISARYFPMFPQLGPVAKAFATMELIEAFFTKRFTYLSRTSRIRTAQMYVYRDALRDGDGDRFVEALSGEFIARAARVSPPPLVITFDTQTGLPGRVLVTMAQLA